MCRDEVSVEVTIDSCGVLEIAKDVMQKGKIECAEEDQICSYP